MRPLSHNQKIDTSQTGIAVEYLRTCRETLANLTVPEAMAAFLREMADQFADSDSDLALYLRQQASRIGTGDEIRHAVRHGIPQIALTRDQVGERLRKEEDRRLALHIDPIRAVRLHGCLLVVGAFVAAALGVGLWGVLWMMDVDEPWDIIMGAGAAIVVFVIFHRGLAGVLRNLLSQESEEPKP